MITSLKQTILDYTVKFLNAIQSMNGNRLQNKITIVTFHRILPEKYKSIYPIPNLVITPEELTWILSFCKEHYNCLNLSEAFEKTSNKKPSLVITFDDGQLDNILYAIPILNQLKLKATFYLPAFNVEKSLPLWHDILGFYILKHYANNSRNLRPIERSLDINLSLTQSPYHATQLALINAKNLTNEKRLYLINELADIIPEMPEWASIGSWSDFSSVANMGHEIGSHTMTHPILTKCSRPQLVKEIAGSHKLIRRRINTQITSLCYPNGDFDDRCIEIAKNAGYKNAVTTDFRVNNLKESQYTLGRLDMISSRLRSRRNNDLDLNWLSWRMSPLKPYIDNRNIQIHNRSNPPT